MPVKSTLKLVAPATILRAVAPRRRPNTDFRTREHLTPTEIEKLPGGCAMQPARRIVTTP